MRKTGVTLINALFIGAALQAFASYFDMPIVREAVGAQARPAEWRRLIGVSTTRTLLWCYLAKVRSSTPELRPISTSQKDLSVSATAIVRSVVGPPTSTEMRIHWKGTAEEARDAFRGIVGRVATSPNP
jgi:hypothetical protein